jgi:hypothetical protein
MDVASRPLSRRDRRTGVGAGPSVARIALTILIAATIGFVGGFAGSTGSHPRAPESDLVLIAPLRWY